MQNWAYTPQGQNGMWDPSNKTYQVKRLANNNNKRKTARERELHTLTQPQQIGKNMLFD